MSSLLGSCSFMMAIFGSFGAQAYVSDEAAAEALAARTATGSRPYSGCARESRVRLADKVEATVYSWGPGTGETGPCLAVWQDRGWTFLISGMTPYLWVGGPWTVTADKVVAYVAGHRLPDRGEMDSANAGDGLNTTLTWRSGAELYNAFVYHGALPALDMAASMAPYPRG